MKATTLLGIIAVLMLIIIIGGVGCTEAGRVEEQGDWVAAPLQMDSEDQWPCFYCDVEETRPDVAYYFNSLPENNHFVSAEDLYESVTENPEGLFLLDIRQAEDYQRSHIDGALNIWWHDVGERLDELPMDQPIVVICNTGQSAAQLVGVLQSIGYRSYSLLGGMNNGWLSEGYPVVSTSE